MTTTSTTASSDENTLEEVPHTDLARGPLVMTTIVCLVAGAAGHVVLWVGWTFEWRLPWQPVAGICLTIVSVAAFGGFYVASRRARIAISAAFLLTFLVMLPYVLTIEAMAFAAQGEAKELVDDFRTVVTTIIAFYFGTEAFVSVSKVIGIARAGGTAAEIQSSDRDLVGPLSPRRTA